MEHSIPVGIRHIEGEIISELTEAHRKIILSESRLKLMEDLLKRRLCTRDIYSFACSQADICVTTSDLDWSTIKSAMLTKIRDLRQTLKDDHRIRRMREKDLLTQLGRRSWKVRKTIKNIKNSLKQEEDRVRKKHMDKINHYKLTMTRLTDHNKEAQTSTTQSVDMNGMNNQTEEGGGSMGNGLLL